MRNGYGHMVHDYYVARLRARHAERRARLEALRTRDDALAYQAKIRQAVKRAFGPFPQRTPLNPRTTGSFERPGYRVENVLFESLPGFQVTANLYIPTDLDVPAPCVLGACGHSADGKAAPIYQAFCQRLVLNGFVVLIYDPINQGERDQYALLGDRETTASCTSAHNMMGKQMELLGDYLGSWRAWDGIRALDYLLSRSEVDPTRAGLTGNSGGGTMTTWLWPLDERFTMAAPSCFVTTFLRNLENELPADCEQYPPGVLAEGLEMADFVIARAPEPVAVLGQRYCFFDRRGHQEACDELARFYKLLGAPEENFACFRGDHPHGFFPENQEAMVRFFARHAGLPSEPCSPPPAEPEEVLFATTAGNVIRDGSRPIYEILTERAEKAAANRPHLSGEALRDSLRGMLSLPDDRPRAEYRVLRPTEQCGRIYGRYGIETEPGILAIVRKRLDEPAYSQTLDVSGEARLYVPHLSAEEDLVSDTLALELQEQHELYALDPRGMGESLPDEEGGFWQPYGMDYMFHGHGLLFAESYMGRRVLDVLATADLLLREGATALHLYGRGQGALLALFAAVLHDSVSSVTLKNGPTSFAEWIREPIVDWPSACFPKGALVNLDLDDCMAALRERMPVRVVEPWGARMRSV